MAIPQLPAAGSSAWYEWAQQVDVEARKVAGKASLASPAFTGTPTGIVSAGITDFFPLGCAENPVLDPAGLRPTGIPVVWWRVPTEPTNAVAGDMIWLPDTTVTPPATVVKYLQAFGTDAGGWVAGTNSSGVVRDTARYAGGALRWTVTAAASSTVKSPPVTGLSGSTQYTLTATVSHDAASSRPFVLIANEYGTAGYLANISKPAVIVPAGSTATTIVWTFTTSANTTSADLFVEVQEMAAGGYGYLDNIELTTP